MKDRESQAAESRRPYVPPAVERVVLDPIKEMLEVCDESLGGKGANCKAAGGFVFS